MVNDLTSAQADMPQRPTLPSRPPPPIVDPRTPCPPDNRPPAHLERLDYTILEGQPACSDEWIFGVDTHQGIEQQHARPPEQHNEQANLSQGQERAQRQPNWSGYRAYRPESTTREPGDRLAPLLNSSALIAAETSLEQRSAADIARSNNLDARFSSLVLIAEYDHGQPAPNPQAAQGIAPVAPMQVGHLAYQGLGQQQGQQAGYQPIYQQGQQVGYQPTDEQSQQVGYQPVDQYQQAWQYQPEHQYGGQHQHQQMYYQHGTQQTYYQHQQLDCQQHDHQLDHQHAHHQEAHATPQQPPETRQEPGPLPLPSNVVRIDQLKMPVDPSPRALEPHEVVWETDTTLAPTPKPNAASPLDRNSISGPVAGAISNPGADARLDSSGSGNLSPSRADKTAAAKAFADRQRLDPRLTDDINPGDGSGSSPDFDANADAMDHDGKDSAINNGDANVNGNTTSTAVAKATDHHHPRNHATWLASYPPAGTVSVDSGEQGSSTSVNKAKEMAHDETNDCEGSRPEPSDIFKSREWTKRQVGK